VGLSILHATMLNPDMTVWALPQTIIRHVIPTGPTAFDMCQVPTVPSNIFPTVPALALITLKYFPAERFHCLAF